MIKIDPPINFTLSEENNRFLYTIEAISYVPENDKEWEVRPFSLSGYNRDTSELKIVHQRFENWKCRYKSPYHSDFKLVLDQIRQQVNGPLYQMNEEKKFELSDIKPGLYKPSEPYIWNSRYGDCIIYSVYLADDFMTTKCASVHYHITPNDGSTPREYKRADLIIFVNGEDWLLPVVKIVNEEKAAAKAEKDAFYDEVLF